jgi:LmbE family N-acetylglucosaminyl deacetylase
MSEKLILPPRVRALFVSPHLDDVPLSCGGAVAHHAAAGDRPVVLTLFGGAPGSAPISEGARRFHRRAQVGADEGDRLNEIRVAEERAAIATLGAASRILAYKDAIYRGMQYVEDRQLTDEIHPADAGLIEELGQEMELVWRRTDKATVYLPLGIGSHVDHQICAGLYDRLRRAGATVRHYEDVPYLLHLRSVEGSIRRIRIGRRDDEPASCLEQHLRALGLTPSSVDVTAHFAARLEAIEKYASQLPYLFAGDLPAAISEYAASLGPSGHWERFWCLPPPQP